MVAHATGEAVRRARRDVASLVGLFLALNAASLAYTLITWEYNGDFFGVPVGLSLSQVLLGFVASCLPFLCLWGGARLTIAIQPTRQVSVPLHFLRAFVPALLIAQLLLTWRFGLGVIGQPAADIPTALKPVALFVNRFQPFYIGCLLLLLLPREHRTARWETALLVALIMVVGLMRAGLGAFLYVGLTLLLKYRGEIARFARRRFVVLVLLLAALPLIVAQLYTLRNSLREGTDWGDLPVMTLATGIFLGRVSSLSNTLVIAEEGASLSANRQLGVAYHAQQAAAGILGARLGPATSPQAMLVESFGGDSEFVSYMTGMPGDLLVALSVSPLSPVLNIVLTVLLTGLTLWTARLWRCDSAVPFATLLLLYPTMSGVASELAAVLFFWFLMTAVILVANGLRFRYRATHAIA